MSSFTMYGHVRFLCSILLILLITAISSGASSTRLYYQCPNTTTYAPNSTYRANLNILLSALSNSTATRDSAFYNFTVGRDPPSVAYGLFLCRGDVTVDACRSCVQSATDRALRLCPNQTSATLWYDECMLRYSNRYIFSSMDTLSSRLVLQNTQNVSDIALFQRVFPEVMDDVAAGASSDRSGQKFATSEANYTPPLTLYSLAQCTPDLSASDCNTCLRDAISNLQSCCSRSVGGTVLFPSCNLRFELYPFYNVSASPPTFSPSTPPTPTGNGKGGISTQVIIAIVVPIVVAVVLFVVGFWCIMTKAKKKKDATTQETGKSSI